MTGCSGWVTPNPYQPVACRVVAAVPETSDTVTLTIAPPPATAWRFQPGQFNMVSLYGVGEAPISIASDPADPEGLVQHTVRAVGRLTRPLTTLRPGDTVWLRGPYGRPWPLDAWRSRDLLLVTGGLGLAPVRPVVLAAGRARHLFGRIELLYGARTPGDLLYRDALQEWARVFDMTVRVTVDAVPPDQVWAGPVGVVTRLYEAMTSRPGAVALACWPELMMRFALQGLLDRGFPASDLYVSLERRMECGFGHCGRCALGPVKVCRDGPVFCWDELAGRVWVEDQPVLQAVGGGPRGPAAARRT